MENTQAIAKSPKLKIGYIRHALDEYRHTALIFNVLSNQVKKGVGKFNINQAINQIFGQYKNAYDRLTRGFSITEYIGYQYLSTDGNLNFNIGFEFNQAFTSGVRSVDFTTNELSPNGRKDFLSGFKVTWLIPLYSSSKGEQIYY